MCSAGGIIFGWSSANLGNSSSNFFAYRFVSFNSVSLSPDIFTFELFSCLSHPELIGCKLCSVHPIHQLFFGVDPFTSFDCIRSKPSIEPFVADIMEDAEHYLLIPQISPPLSSEINILEELALVVKKVEDSYLDFFILMANST